MAKQIKKVQISEKVSYNIHPCTTGLGIAMVERVFKGNVRAHVLIEEALVDELTSSKESWKATIAKYDLMQFSGRG